jgi:hypothetical protein
MPGTCEEAALPYFWTAANRLFAAGILRRRPRLDRAPDTRGSLSLIEILRTIFMSHSLVGQLCRMSRPDSMPMLPLAPRRRCTPEWTIGSAFEDPEFQVGRGEHDAVTDSLDQH